MPYWDDLPTPAPIDASEIADALPGHVEQSEKVTVYAPEKNLPPHEDRHKIDWFVLERETRDAGSLHHIEFSSGTAAVSMSGMSDDGRESTLPKWRRTGHSRLSEFSRHLSDDDVRDPAQAWVSFEFAVSQELEAVVRTTPYGTAYLVPSKRPTSDRGSWAVVPKSGPDEKSPALAGGTLADAPRVVGKNSPLDHMSNGSRDMLNPPEDSRAREVADDLKDSITTTMFYGPNSGGSGGEDTPADAPGDRPSVGFTSPAAGAGQTPDDPDFATFGEHTSVNVGGEEFDVESMTLSVDNRLETSAADTAARRAADAQERKAIRRAVDTLAPDGESLPSWFVGLLEQSRVVDELAVGRDENGNTADVSFKLDEGETFSGFGVYFEEPPEEVRKALE